MPHVTGANFDKFVTTVCPSKNAHIRQSALAGFVKKLDMGELVHDGSKSLTARILGRLKATLAEFRAPQASFSVNCFAALSKCRALTHLDLSLMSAAISIKYVEFASISIEPSLTMMYRTLFHTLEALDQLETLFFPRTSIHDYSKEAAPYTWPPKLRALHLAGGIDDVFLRIHVTNVPITLERLSIQHCTMVYPGAVRDSLQAIGPRLRHLTLRHPMNRLWAGAVDSVLSWCPHLTALRISADYVSEAFLEKPNVFEDHPLQILDIDCSPSAGPDVCINPDVVWSAIDDGLLPWLRSVRVNARMAWNATQELRENMTDLSDLMIALEKERPSGIKAGVWVVIG